MLTLSEWDIVFPTLSTNRKQNKQTKSNTQKKNLIVIKSNTWFEGRRVF